MVILYSLYFLVEGHFGLHPGFRDFVQFLVLHPVKLHKRLHPDFYVTIGFCFIWLSSIAIARSHGVLTS